MSNSSSQSIRNDIDRLVSDKQRLDSDKDRSEDEVRKQEDELRKIGNDINDKDNSYREEVRILNDEKSAIQWKLSWAQQKLVEINRGIDDKQVEISELEREYNNAMRDEHEEAAKRE